MRTFAALLAVCFSLLVTLCLAEPSAPAPAARPLRQAKRADIVARERFPDLFSRDAELLGRDDSSAVCTCPAGPDAGMPCPSNPAAPTPVCTENCPTSRRRKRSGVPERVRHTIVQPEEFDGELLNPAQVAVFLKADGTFPHSNGSALTDYDYLDRSTLFRRGTAKRSRIGMVGRIRSGLVDFSVGTLGRGIARSFSDPNRVFRLSDDFGIRTGDVIRLLKELMADPELQEVNVWQHRIRRPTIQKLLSVLCPRMGPEFCNDSLDSDED